MIPATNNGVTSEIFGQIDLAGAFDGGSFIEAENNVSLSNGVLGFSVAAWVNTLEASRQMAIYDDEGPATGFTKDRFVFEILNGAPVLFVRDRFGFSGTRADRELISSTVIADGEWHHVVAMIREDLKTLEFYIDGQPDAVFQLTFSFLAGTAPRCDAACDSNGDGIIAGDVGDAVHILNFNVLGGLAPVDPFPLCGLGTLATDIALGCAEPPAGCVP